eukprot:jgi/Botrbrau1/14701/Bobra.0108s0054.2
MALPVANILATALVGCAVLTVFGWIQAWFKGLNDESGYASTNVLLENPCSVQKIPASSLFEEASKALTVVIPAYNEQDRLPGTLDETMRYLQRRRDQQGPHFTFEVIVVDDGSADDTVRVALDFARKYGTDALRVLALPRNHGKGYAVRSGMMIARGDLLLFLDADGATRVSDMEKLENELRKKLASEASTSPAGAVVQGQGSAGMGMAVGSRAHLEKDAIAKRTAFRNFLMHGFHLLVVAVAGTAIRDTQCGFKMFSRPAARLLFPNQRLQRWCFDVELIFLADKLGIPVCEVAVNWTEIPGSKISWRSIVFMAWELAAILLGYVVLPLWRVHGQDEVRTKH